MHNEVQGATTTPQHVRRARAATYALLFANGLAVTSYSVRVPALVAQLNLSNAQFGLILSSIGIGSIFLTLLTGIAVSRFGVRRVSIMSVGFFGAAFPLIGLATSFWTFAAAVFLAGAGSAAVEVSASASGSRLERAYGKPMMPGFIGYITLGMLAGTLVGAASLALDISTFAHVAGIGIAIWLVGLFACPRQLTPTQDKTTGDLGHLRRHLPRLSWRLVAICIVILISVIEGSILNFATLYMTQDLGAAAAIAAFAVTAHAIGTAGVQLSGDWLRQRFSPAFLVRVGVVTGGFILAVALLMQNLWFALFGFAAFGAGAGLVYPAGVSAAADTQQTPAPGAAAAQTVRYIGIFGAGPIIGFLAGAGGLTNAFLITIGFGTIIAALFAGSVGRQVGLGERSGGELPDIMASDATSSSPPANQHEP